MGKKGKTVILWIITVVFFLFSCSSTPKSGSGEFVPSEITSLYVPGKNNGFFSFPDPGIMTNMEIGSPKYLRQAVTKVKNSGIMTDKEKVILTIASEIMSTVWVSETTYIEKPKDISPNVYTEAIATAKSGLYDENTGKYDFFTTVLPSLVLFSSSTDTSYYPQALEDLNSALKMNENSVLVLYMLGYLHESMGNYSEALKMYSRAIELDGDCFECFYRAINVKLSLGNYGDVYREAENLLKKYPQNLDLLKLCAKSSYYVGDYAKAEDYIAQVLQQDSTNAEYILLRIKILVEQKDYVKASTLLDLYARTDKKAKEYLLLRSRVQLEWNKNTIAAASSVEQALELYPNDYDVLLAAASLASSSKRKIAGLEASDFAEMVLEKDPGNQEALYILAQKNIESENWNEAYNTTKTLLGEENPSLEIKLLHVRACIGLGYTKEASQIIEALYKEYPDSEAVKESYIRVLVSKKDYATAQSLISTYLPSASSSFKSFLYYQQSLMTNSDTEKLAALRQSLTANPRNIEPLFELYVYYYKKADYRKAQYYLKQVVSLDSSNEEYLRLNQELDSLLK